jgi:hypothetical protein
MQMLQRINILIREIMDLEGSVIERNEKKDKIKIFPETT